MMKMILIPVLMLASPAFAKTKAAAKDAKGNASIGALKIDTAASKIEWTGQKAVVKSAHNGTINLKSGELELSKGQIVKGTFDIDMASLTNEDLKADAKKKGDLEGHLKSEDFFDVAKFPTATYKITGVKEIAGAAAGQPTHEFMGTLTLKGKTEPLTIPAVVKMTDTGAEATANVEIDRTTWNVRYGSDKFFKSLGDKVIADKIALNLKIVATK